MENRKQSMMKVVAPLRIHPIAAKLFRFDHPRIIQIAFSNQYQPPAQLHRQALHLI